MRGRISRLMHRQSLLLHLLSACGGQATNVGFQKILFFFCQAEREEGAKPSYDFYPHMKGGFSFTANYDRLKLQEYGLLSDDSRDWSLRTSSKDEILRISPSCLCRVNRVVSSLSGKSEDALIKHMYVQYPEYAVNSVIADRVLSDRKDILEKIAHIKSRTVTQAIRTIGYEGLTIEEYFKRLYQAGVTLLCDVRRFPFSHKLGFSRSQLADLCQAVKIEYRHFPELGIPSHRRRALNSQADYDVLFEEYEYEDLPKVSEIIKKIARLVLGGQRIALTCFEEDPQMCHRSVVGKYLSQMTKQPLVHLTAPSTICRKKFASLF